jgi:hypothetical protein
MRRPSRFHQFVEGLLPWFDPDAEQKRNERTEAIRQRSIRARINVEKLAADYRKAPWPRR